MVKIINKQNIYAYLESLTFKNKTINFVYNIEASNKKEVESYKKSIVLKNRDTNSEYIFNTSKVRGSFYKTTIDSNSLSKINLENTTNTIDIYLRLSINEKDIDTLIYVKENYNQNLNFKYEVLENNKYYRYKPYETGDNTLSIYIRISEIEANISRLLLEGDKPNIQGYISSKEFDIWSVTDRSSYIVLKKRKKIDGNYDYRYSLNLDCYEKEILIDIKLLNTYFALNENLVSKIINEDKEEDEIWDMFIRVTDIDENTQDLILKYLGPCDNYIEVMDYRVRIFSNKFNGGLSYYIYKNVNNLLLK